MLSNVFTVFKFNQAWIEWGPAIEMFLNNFLEELTYFYHYTCKSSDLNYTVPAKKPMLLSFFAASIQMEFGITRISVHASLGANSDRQLREL